jgi:glutathione synthase/RimK-type ligase-like ATP-grasp enzyme
MERDTENGGRMSDPRLAVLCPTPEYEEDWSHIKADYIRLFGEDTAFIDWTKADDLAAFDLITPLLAWGYPRDTATWFALLDRMEARQLRVANPVRVLRWNSDKSYLAELDVEGIATVPTRMSTALDLVALAAAREAFACDMLVVKPPISGGAEGTFRLSSGDTIPASVADKRMMIQPYLPSIAAEGEYSLFYFGGQLSHAIIKRPATGDFRVQEQFGGKEEAVVPLKQAETLAMRALAAASKITETSSLAYARVDMLRDREGQFRLMELELIEPSLFLHFAPDGGESFARFLLSAGC